MAIQVEIKRKRKEKEKYLIPTTLVQNGRNAKNLWKKPCFRSRRNPLILKTVYLYHATFSDQVVPNR